MAGVVFLSGQDVSLVTPHFPLGDVEPIQSAAVVGESDCGGIPAHAAIHIQHNRPGKERERDVLFNDTLNTFSYGYMVVDGRNKERKKERKERKRKGRKERKKEKRKKERKGRKERKKEKRKKGKEERMEKRKKGIIMDVNIYLTNRIKINGRNN